MSLQIVVFVPTNAVHPTAERWSAVAQRHGFELKVATAFNAATHSCGLPLVCDGLEATVEFYNDSISDYLDETRGDFPWWTRLRLRRYARAVGFVTHSRHDDWRAACVAAATYASATNGRLLDCQTGRFLRPAAAATWARGAAEPVPDGLPILRARIREATHSYVADVLADLGYQRTPTPPDVASPSDRWYARPGSQYTNELAEVSVYFDSNDSYLSTAFYGTTEQLELLQREGVIGRAAGRDRFDYLHYVVGRPSDTVLPKNVPVAEDFSSTPAAASLRSEIHSIHPGIFQDLWERFS